MGGDVALESRPGPHRRDAVAGAAARGVRATSRALDDRFHVKTGRPATVSRMRPGAVAVVALVSAVLGRRRRAAGRQGEPGWIDDDGAVRPWSSAPTPADDAVRAPEVRRRRCVGNASTRSDLRPHVAGRRHDLRRLRRRPQRAAGLRLRRLHAGPRPHELARDHARRARRRDASRRGASSVYVVFADGDRLPADDRGLGPLQRHGRDQGRTRAITRSRRCRSATPSRSSSASRWPRSAARSGTRTRSRSASSSADSRSIPSLTSRYDVSSDPDRRADQPRQLRWAAARRARPRDRDQRADPLRVRQRRGRRLRDPDQLGAALDGAADRDRPGRLRLHRHHDAGRDARARARFGLGVQRGALIAGGGRRAAGRAGRPARRRRSEELFNGSTSPRRRRDRGDRGAGRAQGRRRRAHRHRASCCPGRSSRLTVLRGGGQAARSLRVRLAERPATPNP